MKIIEMTATFGCLNKATLRPGEGFTLVEASNESGKSTWCAFLRAMLYGFPARDRTKEGYLAEKTRYQPWSGAPMEGTLTLEWKGRSITIYRGPKGSTPWGTFSATYTATGESVPGLTGETCGETLLGVSREVFDRTAFVSQGEVALSPSADLEKRAAALASSGEEEVSFSQVERRLKDWLNRRRSNARNGLIPQIEGKLAQINETADCQSDLLRRHQEALQTQEALTARRDELKTKLEALQAQQDSLLSHRRAKAQAEYDELLAKVEQLEKTTQALPDAETLRSAQGDLSYLNTLTANLRQADQEAPLALSRARQAEEEAENDPYFGGKIPPQVAVQAQRDHSEAQQLKKKPSLPLWLFLGALIGAVPGIIAFPLQPDFLVHWMITMELWGKDELATVCIAGFGLFLKWLILPGALIGLVLAGILCLLRRHSRKKALTALLAQYNVQAPEDILTRAADYNKKVENAQELRRKYEAVESDRAKFLAQKDELTAQLLALVHPFEPNVTTVDGISAAISRALQQGEACRMAENDLKAAQKLLSALPAPRSVSGQTVPVDPVPGGEDPEALARELREAEDALSQAQRLSSQLYGQLQAMGDPSGWEGEKSALTMELERRQGEYDSLAIALEALKAADSQLQERFSPAINQRAGEYLSRLTGGKYDKAALTRQFQAAARETGETALRQDLTLSGGAAQQLYLAARLAMCDLALPQAEPCPILLDDVLDAFDDDRAKLALDCLLETAQARQVLLFTCHSREKEMLKNAPVTVVNL